MGQSTDPVHCYQVILWFPICLLFVSNFHLLTREREKEPTGSACPVHAAIKGVGLEVGPVEKSTPNADTGVLGGGKHCSFKSMVRGGLKVKVAAG